MTTAYYNISSNNPTQDLIYNLEETNTLIASVPYTHSNGYFGLLMSDGTKTAEFQYDTIGQYIMLINSNTQNDLISHPTVSISNNTLSISTHINSIVNNIPISIKSSGSNYGEGVIVGSYNNKLYLTVPNEEQIIITPPTSMIHGTYLNEFNVTDTNNVNWKFKSHNIRKTYDVLEASNFNEIVYSNGTIGASNVDVNFFMSNFANVVTNSNGFTINNFKRGPAVETIFNSIVYTGFSYC